MQLLRESGPVPGDENGAAKAAGAKGADAKKKRPTKNVDMEKLADGLQKLDEDNLLNVVQLIHDHKTSDTYTKNDVESKC
jgi:transcription initiation factor IIF auxiliary subunit